MKKVLKVLFIVILVILFLAGIKDGTINLFAFMTNINESSDIRERVVAGSVSIWSFFVLLFSLILTKSIIYSPEGDTDNKKNNTGFINLITFSLIILLLIRLMFSVVSY